MIGKSLPKITPGFPHSHRAFDSTIALTARDLNAPRAEIERFGKMRGSNGLNVWNTPSGPKLSISLPATMYIQLTGPANDAGGYPWKQVVRVFELGFQPTGFTGSNVVGDPGYAPAYESQNGDTTLTADNTTYYAIQAATSGEWQFDGKN